MFLSSPAFRKIKNGYRRSPLSAHAPQDVRHLKPVEKRQESLDVGSVVSSEPAGGRHTDTVETLFLSPENSMATTETPSFHTDRLRKVILDPAHATQQMDECFSPGNDTGECREERKKWLIVENELHHVQSLASRSVHSSSASAQLRLLEQLRQAIVHAMHYLLEGTNLNTGMCRDEENPFKLETEQTISLQARKNARSFRKSNCSKHPLYYVWSSPQMARSAIVQESIALGLKQSNTAHLNNARPLVLLVIERRPNFTVESKGRSYKTGREFSEQDSFLSSWTRATFGIADAITVAVDTSDQIQSSLQKMLQKSAIESSVVPALVCLHASGDSTIPSNISAVRTLCDIYQTRLCIEGSALALLAQPSRPSTPEECLRKAHVLLLDPGSWFGFKMCAVVTRHEPCNSRTPNSHPERRHGISSIEVLASCDNEDKHGHATGPVLNLWTVFSRVGLKSIRERIEQFTVVAESFLHHLEASPNMQTIYEGIGCVVRMSFVLSREDRVLAVEKAVEKISAVNKAVVCSLEEESKRLLVHTIQSHDILHIQFSPSQFLCSGTFWCPSEDDTLDYVSKLQTAVNKYEPCKAGRIEFEGRAVRCRDISFAISSEDAPALSLSLGAFRIVPHEFSNSWTENASSLDVMNNLSGRFVSELETISENPDLQQEFERCGILLNQAGLLEIEKSFNNPAPPSLHEDSSECACIEDELPFVIYLNSKLETGGPDFISIEPKEACNPAQAIRHARLAAEVVVTIVDVVVSRWRDSNISSTISADIRTLAGTEDTIPQELSRERCGYAAGTVNVLSSRDMESVITGTDTSHRTAASSIAGEVRDLFVETDSDQDSRASTFECDEESIVDNQDIQEANAGDELFPPNSIGTTRPEPDRDTPLLLADKKLTLSAHSHIRSREEDDTPFLVGPGTIGSEASSGALQPKRSGKEPGSPSSAAATLQSTPVRSHWLGIWNRGGQKAAPVSNEEGDDQDDGYEDYDEESGCEESYSSESEDVEGDANGSSSSSNGEGLRESDEGSDDESDEKESSDDDSSSVDEESSALESGSDGPGSESESDGPPLTVAAPRGVLGWLRGSAGAGRVGEAERGEEDSSSDGDSQQSVSWSRSVGVEEEGSDSGEAEKASDGRAWSRGSRRYWIYNGESGRSASADGEYASDEGDESASDEESGESASDEGSSVYSVSEQDRDVGEHGSDADSGQVVARPAAPGYGFGWLARGWAGRGAGVEMGLGAGSSAAGDGSAGARGGSSSRLGSSSGSSATGSDWSSGAGSSGSTGSSAYDSEEGAGGEREAEEEQDEDGSDWSEESEEQPAPEGKMRKYLKWLAPSAWGGGGAAPQRNRSERFGGSDESESEYEQEERVPTFSRGRSWRRSSRSRMIS